MKPIEIHIEGYKIVISEDKDEPSVKKVTVPADDDLKLPFNPDWPYPSRYPYVTWTDDDTFNIKTTSDFQPIRQGMVNGTTTMPTGGTVTAPEKIGD